MIKKIFAISLVFFLLFANPVFATTNTKSIELEKSSSQALSITDGDQTGLAITGDISIACWVKAESFISNNTIAGKEDYNNGDYGYLLRVLNGKVNFLYRSGSSNTRQRITSDALSTDTWYHIVATADVSAQDINIYIDGSLASMAAAVGSATSIVNNNASFKIGIDSTSEFAAAYWDGLIDEVSVWSKELSSTEVSENYNSGNGEILEGTETDLEGYWRFEDDLLDETSNDNDLTNNNSATYSTDIPFGGSTPATTRRVMFIN